MRYIEKNSENLPQLSCPSWQLSRNAKICDNALFTEAQAYTSGSKRL